MRPRKIQVHSDPERDLVESTRSLDACVEGLVEIGLSNEEIEKLDQVLGAIINNQIDNIKNKYE